jgi:hypothetical protein
MDRIVLQYGNHQFTFEVTDAACFDGRHILNDHDWQLLAALIDAEPDDWCLDGDGERLPAEKLFALTPWSYTGPDGPAKLLCRFLARDRAIFNTPDSYPGELFRWVRSEPPPDAP